MREDQVRPASFFILGTALHDTIQRSIEEDFDLDYAKAVLAAHLDRELAKVANLVVVEGVQRSMASIYDDAERMIINWFAHVHPHSDKRHPFYDDYVWPPKTEVRFYHSDLGTRYPVWGSIDALFEAKPIEARNYGTGNGLAIVDWKSGNKRPDSQFQLDYYRFGAEMPEAVAAYHMLDRVRKQSIVVEAKPYPGDTGVRAAISGTERTKQQVVSGVVPTFSPGWQCGYCPVQHICPEDGDPRNRKRNLREFKKVLATAEAMPLLP